MHDCNVFENLCVWWSTSTYICPRRVFLSDWFVAYKANWILLMVNLLSPDPNSCRKVKASVERTAYAYVFNICTHKKLNVFSSKCVHTKPTIEWYKVYTHVFHTDSSFPKSPWQCINILSSVTLNLQLKMTFYAKLNFVSMFYV